MAVITYTQDAALMSYQSWLMQQGNAAILERQCSPQNEPTCANMPGAVVAQAGSLIRYSVLTTLTSATVFFGGQFQTLAGQWQNVAETVIGTSAGGIDAVLRPAVAGCYKNLVATVGTAVVAGTEVYVLAELGRINNGVFQPYAVLVSGYIRTNEPIDSGGGPRRKDPPPSGGGGGGCCLETNFPDTWDPDSDNPYTYPREPDANARLVYLEYGYTTGAGGGNRRQYLLISPPSGYGFEVFSTVDQPGGVQFSYAFQAGGPPYYDAGLNRHYFPLPDSLWFSSDILVTIQASNPGGSDAWSFTTALFSERGP